MATPTELNDSGSDSKSSRSSAEESEGQLSALRALRSEGTFAAYALEWKYQFLRQDS